MAKVKFAWKAFDAAIEALPERIVAIEAATGKKVAEIEIEMSGSIDIDRDGGIGADVEASANALAIAAGGAPVTVKAGAGSKWDNQASLDWKIRYRVA